MNNSTNTPPLVDVIAGVLAAHKTISVALYPDYYCRSCGYRSMDQPSAHQARAVLAALEGAGGVEWGVLATGQEKPYTYDSQEAAQASLDKSSADGAVVSRIVGPWTEVAG